MSIDGDKVEMCLETLKEGQLACMLTELMNILVIYACQAMRARNWL